MERNILIKGVAFGCTQSGGAPHFHALARTLYDLLIPGDDKDVWWWTKSETDEMLEVAPFSD